MRRIASFEGSSLQVLNTANLSNPVEKLFTTENETKRILRIQVHQQQENDPEND